MAHDKDWYNAQYADPKSHYGKIYGNVPPTSQGMSQYTIDMCIALMGLAPSQHRILEMGAGIGSQMDAWEYRNFDVMGVDFSQAAINISGRTNIICADANDVPFSDEEFDVVFSCSFLEHIPHESCANVLKEMYRVAKTGIHLIDCLNLDPGADPSHVNIKTVKEWQSWFASQLNGWRCYLIPNPCACCTILYSHTTPRCKLSSSISDDKMTTIKFLRFRFGGAVTFKEIQSIPLDDQGIVQVLGENYDSGDGDRPGSNGAGKSLIFNLFADMIRGKFPNGQKTTEAISPHGNFFRELTFQRGPDDYIFREFRDWKGNDEFPRRKDGYEFFKNGEPYGARRIPEARKYIADFFGWSEGEFYSSVFFHQDGIHVLVTGSSADRRKYIETLFDLGLFDEMRVLIDEELSDLQTSVMDLDGLQQELHRLRTTREELGSREVWQERQETLRGDRKTLQAKIEGLDVLEEEHRQAELTQQKRESLTQQRRDIKTEMDALPDPEGKSVQEIQDSLAPLARHLAEARHEESKAERRETLLDGLKYSRDLMAGPEEWQKRLTEQQVMVESTKKAEFELKALERDLGLLEDVTAGKCPHCKQPITEDHIKRCREDIQTKIKPFADQMRHIDIDALEHGISACEELLTLGTSEPSDWWADRVASQEQQHTERVKQMQSAETHERLRKSYSKIHAALEDLPASVQMDVKDIAEQRHEVMRRMEQCAERRTKVESTLEQIQNLNEDMERIKPKLEKLQGIQTDIDLLKVLQRAYGPLGLKVTAVRRISKAIAKTLPRYTNLLFNETVKFTVDSEKDTAFDIRCERTGYNQCDVRALSGGERARLVAALIFTVNDLCNPSKRSNIIILDEPDKSLDDYPGKLALQENLLPELRKRFKTVVFISHADTSRSSVHFDRTWTVSKINATSVLL